MATKLGNSLRKSLNNSKILTAVLRSKFPVGSSASITAGLATNARAIATR